MPNMYLYPSKKGPQGGFYVRRELSADKSKYLYWLGHKTEDFAHRVQVTLDFFLDFRKEVKRLKERCRKKPHCGRPACKVAPYCVCTCNRCK